MNSCDIAVTIIQINFCDGKMQIFLGLSLFMDSVMNLVLCVGIQGGVRSISNKVKVVIDRNGNTNSFINILLLHSVSLRTGYLLCGQNSSLQLHLWREKQRYRFRLV